MPVRMITLEFGKLLADAKGEIKLSAGNI